MPSIWKQPQHANVQTLAAIHLNTAVAQLGIEFLEVGDDFIRARVPVDARTRQPMGILHGGVSVLLAETLGSCGANFASPAGSRAVGLDINANHLRSVSVGWVTGVARPVHVGRTTHVWQNPHHQRARSAHLRFKNHHGDLAASRRGRARR
jgi:1,4-dihydroxy-2-naphthoyl-CoA hydrolase